MHLSVYMFVHRSNECTQLKKNVVKTFHHPNYHHQCENNAPRLSAEKESEMSSGRALAHIIEIECYQAKITHIASLKADE